MSVGKMTPITFKEFLAVEIVYLLHNVWTLSLGFEFEPCSAYFAYSIEALKRKWCDDYIEYDYVIGSLRTHNKQFIDLDQLSSATSLTDVQKLYIKNCIRNK